MTTAKHLQLSLEPCVPCRPVRGCRRLRLYMDPVGSPYDLDDLDPRQVAAGFSAMLSRLFGPAV